METSSVKVIDVSGKSEYELEATTLISNGYKPSSDLKIERDSYRYVGGDNQWHTENRTRYIREFTKCA